MNIINPTLNNNIKDVLSVPLPEIVCLNTEVSSLVTQNISISESDWNSFENSWEFSRHPLT